MKESATGRNGADYLRQSITKLLSADEVALLRTPESTVSLVLTRGLSSPVVLEKNGEYLRLSKRRLGEISGDWEFTILLRLIPGTKSLEWWPVEWMSRDGKKLCAEIALEGRRLTNLQIQNELIDISNTWGKSISAQRVTRELERTL
jgi:hypothetical protein